jgi:hypothetical protein
MYQVVVYMPEDVAFNCRICCGNQPSQYELMVRQEMNNCMLNVMDALTASKSVRHLRSVVQQVKQFAMSLWVFAKCSYP